MNEWETIRQWIAERFVVSPGSIEEETNLRKDLNADPLDILELIVAVETTFLPDEKGKHGPEDVVTAGDLLKMMSDQPELPWNENDYIGD